MQNIILISVGIVGAVAALAAVPLLIGAITALVGALTGAFRDHP